MEYLEVDVIVAEGPGQPGDDQSRFFMFQLRWDIQGRYLQVGQE